MIDDLSLRNRSRWAARICLLVAVLLPPSIVGAWIFLGPEALIANVSSVFGLFPKKDQSAYCASKYAIRGFTEVLHQELKDTQVIVSTIHPGHIGTDIARKARDSGNVVNVGLSDEQIESWLQAFKAHGMDPGKAAAIILDGVQEKRRRILVGDDAVRSDQLSRKDPEGFADASNTAAV